MTIWEAITTRDRRVLSADSPATSRSQTRPSAPSAPGSRAAFSLQTGCRELRSTGHRGSQPPFTSRPDSVGAYEAFRRRTGNGRSSRHSFSASLQRLSCRVVFRVLLPADEHGHEIIPAVKHHHQQVAGDKRKEAAHRQEMPEARARVAPIAQARPES